MVAGWLGSGFAGRGSGLVSGVSEFQSVPDDGGEVFVLFARFATLRAVDVFNGLSQRKNPGLIGHFALCARLSEVGHGSAVAFSKNLFGNLHHQFGVPVPLAELHVHFLEGGVHHFVVDLMSAATDTLEEILGASGIELFEAGLIVVLRLGVEAVAGHCFKSSGETIHDELEEVMVVFFHAFLLLSAVIPGVSFSYSSFNRPRPVAGRVFADVLSHFEVGHGSFEAFTNNHSGNIIQRFVAELVAAVEFLLHQIVGLLHLVCAHLFLSARDRHEDLFSLLRINL